VGGVIIITLILVAFATDTNLFSIKSALLALPIYAVGVFCKKYDMIELVSKRYHALILTIIGFTYTLTLGMYNSKISMDRADYGDNIFLFYIDALVATLSLIFLFKALQIRSRLISYIGTATLSILVTHLYAIFIKTIITIKVLHYSAGSEPIVYSLVAALIGVAVGLICNKLCLKYFPLAIGKASIR
jgi:fucose 4-O-acetylase-like acetyltransferase